MTDTDPLTADDAVASFDLGIHVVVDVLASDVPDEWMGPEGEIPKRLYNWPTHLLDALKGALDEYIATTKDGLSFDEATLISDSHDLPPSTN